YAYHLSHLATELEQIKLTPVDSPLAAELRFTPQQWKQVVELITASALHQQFSDGERIGTYPDSISDFNRRNGAFLNPEDILVNVLAIRGHDPDVQTRHLKTDHGPITISSAASINGMSSHGTNLQFNLSFFHGELSHTLVVLSGSQPSEVLV